MAHLSRRAFLKGSAVTAGASVLTLNGLFGFGTVFAQDGGDDPQLMLNIACTAETFACTHYYNALQNAEALALTAQEQNWLRSFLDSELKHKQFLEANGATSLATVYLVRWSVHRSRPVHRHQQYRGKLVCRGVLRATRRLAELGNSLFAATTAQVAAVEAEHQALIRLMGGLQPSFQTAKEPLFFNPSEVVPYFTPFLEGGDGFVRPLPRRRCNQ
ncbi:MAG: twin-arginine translocation signal domain-containing protein [Chloroflexi bacterium]|uniref:twin-arginine translocation signal domain-containing protein n=1 Tax=Candidatus Flexifilum breve TaxID=3140694 RepID=UPI0031360695|nr:twin-arginine translocation signal domain-containing protein [Chloroflexota bacterium]